LIEAIKAQPTPFNPDFKNYIGQRFMSCADTSMLLGERFRDRAEECGNEALRTSGSLHQGISTVSIYRGIHLGQAFPQQMIFLLASMNDGAESVR